MLLGDLLELLRVAGREFLLPPSLQERPEEGEKFANTGAQVNVNGASDVRLDTMKILLLATGRRGVLLGVRVDLDLSAPSKAPKFRV